MIAALAQALLQAPSPHTPDTVRYMAAGYTVIGSILAVYAFSLWFRFRKMK